MATDRHDLGDAWRALAGASGQSGWRTIPIGVPGPHRLLAGRRFPGNEEAILIDIGGRHATTLDGFPKGRGFDLEAVTLDHDDARWMALTRTELGSLDLFAVMVEDLIALLDTERSADRADLAGVFLGRIRAWQDFMRRGSDGVLRPDAEVGLFGELTVLSDLLTRGLSALQVLPCWLGPMGGLQDFRLGVGALEVKATAASNGFIARVGSLEQLDTTLTEPIYVAAVRLGVKEGGRTLPELVDTVRDQVGASAARTLLDLALLHAGYLDRARGRYRRRFIHLETVAFRVDGQFARLTRADVPRPIVHARYDLDLDALAAPRLTLADALNLLGVPLP